MTLETDGFESSIHWLGSVVDVLFLFLTGASTTGDLISRLMDSAAQWTFNKFVEKAVLSCRQKFTNVTLL
jgi:hypothetical protein